MRLLALSVLIILTPPNVVSAENSVIDQPSITEIDPPLKSRYQREKKEDETKKYIDPILQRGVDISVLELEAAKRRITSLEEKVDTLMDHFNIVISTVNKTNGQGSKE